MVSKITNEEQGVKFVHSSTGSRRKLLLLVFLVIVLALVTLKVVILRKSHITFWGSMPLSYLGGHVHGDGGLSEQTVT